MYYNPLLEKEQQKCVSKFEKFLKENFYQIESVIQIDEWYHVRFLNNALFKFRFFLPKEKYPVIPNGILNKKPKRLF